MTVDAFELTPGNAVAYVGQTILIGISYHDRRARLAGMRQFSGTIEAVTTVVTVRLDGDTTLTVPPLVRKAAPGVYYVRATGEAIVDPALLSEWSIFQPNRKRAAVERKLRSMQLRVTRRQSRRTRRSARKPNV